jgi:8-oxo-dGTP pyrophosphatase MutT (NUDIX family)
VAPVYSAYQPQESLFAVIIERRSVQQVATLPFSVIDASIEILLVSTRRRGHWTVPKGWPVKGRSFPEAAEAEAREEAGLIGLVDEEPIGSYKYRKQLEEGYSVPCHVFVYPMLVREHRLDWPERLERTLRWSPLGEAAEMVRDRDLGALLVKLEEDGTTALRSVLTRLLAEADSAEAA